jgi:hypothetical protein
MKSLRLVLLASGLTLCRIALTQAPASRPAAPPKPAAQASFDLLKSLAGTWSGSVATDPPNPDLDGPIQVTMRVASGGSLIVHEIAPGGMPEPTMIFVDGERLTLAHYCEAGNRPRLVARPSPDGKSVDFGFADISGNREPAYLSRFLFSILGPDRHTEDWTFQLSGKQSLHAHFDLKRTTAGVAPQRDK